MRLAIVSTHPIQYYAPVFKLLAQKTELMVFYTWGKSSITKHDPGFGKTIKWDIDLLSGYDYKWVNNVAADAGTHHFNGIDNPDLINQINNWQPTEILVYGWAFKSHLSALKYFKNKIPVLFRGDSTLLDERPGIKNLLRSVYLKWIYRHIDYALYTGTNNKAYFKKYGLHDNQLIFAPHAIDNERFAQIRTAETEQLKASLNLTNTDLLVLYAGKLEEKKNPFLLSDAFNKIKQPNLHLLFVGNGTLQQQLKEKAAINSRIHFIDFQNQEYMPVVYQACDLFCLPSKGPGESWGLAVNEAMACGKPILVSNNVGCATDLVTAGNGVIFKTGSLSSLADKLVFLVSKGKSDLIQMGHNSNKIIQNWSFNAQVDSIINYKNGRN